MKKAMTFFVLILIPLFGFSQTIKNLDYIAPFSNEIAAIKKGDQWAFINKDGEMVVNFRNDLVATKSDEGSYPIFKGDRCLIVKEKGGISYFGYIDTSGNTVVAPQFLNASNYENNVATVLELKKETVAKNTALDKNMVYYRYFEVTIDTEGNIQEYLTQKGVSVTLDKDFLLKPPKITAKRIANGLYLVLNENKKWDLKKIND